MSVARYFIVLYVFVIFLLFGVFFRSMELIVHSTPYSVVGVLGWGGGVSHGISINDTWNQLTKWNVCP